MPLTFQPVPPLPLAGAVLPPLARPVGDYAFAWDPARRLLVYAPTPDYHQLQSVHGWDGERWTTIPSPRYRLGSQAQPWRVLWDPRREALVAWSFDGDAPVGVVLGMPGALVGTEDVGRFGEDEVQRVVTKGEHPTRPDDAAWESLTGVFGVDQDRGVTVCLTTEAVYELDGDTWRRVAPATDLPSDASGATSFHQSAGFGSAWDEKGRRLLFWMHDGEHDVPRVFAWKDGRLAKLAADGLPEDLWSWSSGYSVAPHPEHGLIVYVGPAEDEGWYRLEGETFRALPAPTGDAPPRTRGASGGFDAGRGEVVLGPVNHDDTDQQVFHFGDPATGRWRLVGAKRQPCGLKALSSNRVWYAPADGAMCAVDQYLKVLRFGPEDGWTSAVEGAAGDRARREHRAAGAVTGWGGKVHAVLDDGGILRLDADGWHEVHGADEGYGGGASALVAFDPQRGVLVAWGPAKAKGGRKDETWVHDGKAWTKMKKPKARLGGDGDWSLVHDPARGGVVRLGVTELGVFDGKTWTVSPLEGQAPERIFRTVAAHGGRIHVLDYLEGRLLGIEGNRVVEVGAFEAPAPRPDQENTKADFCWFDPTTGRFVLHMQEDARSNFAVAV